MNIIKIFKKRRDDKINKFYYEGNVVLSVYANGEWVKLGELSSINYEQNTHQPPVTYRYSDSTAIDKTLGFATNYRSNWIH